MKPDSEKAANTLENTVPKRKKFPLSYALVKEGFMSERYWRTSNLLHGFDPDTQQPLPDQANTAPFAAFSASLNRGRKPFTK